jgi:hypothetical protein
MKDKPLSWMGEDTGVKVDRLIEKVYQWPVYAVKSEYWEKGKRKCVHTNYV